MGSLVSIFRARGRIGLIEFWLGFLIHSWVLHMLGLEQVVESLKHGSVPQLGHGLGLSMLLLEMWLFWAHLAKRWHDNDWSGLWSFVTVVPVVGWLFCFVMLGLMPGSRRDNRYGPPSPGLKAFRDVFAVLLRPTAGAGTAQDATDADVEVARRPDIPAPPPASSGRRTVMPPADQPSVVVRRRRLGLFS